MNIVTSFEQYDNNCVILCDPIKNNIMNDGNFIRILYSNNLITLNGIYLYILLNDITCEKYFTKFKCYFNKITNKENINKLKNIEENILKKYKVENKIPQYKIYEQIKNGYLKIYNDIENKISQTFILKISGIWETENSYGLTYKFLTSSNKH
jgi:hypothetical protein